MAKVYRKDKKEVLKKETKTYYSGSVKKAPKQSKIYPSGNKVYKLK